MLYIIYMYNEILLKAVKGRLNDSAGAPRFLTCDLEWRQELVLGLQYEV